MLASVDDAPTSSVEMEKPVQDEPGKKETFLDLYFIIRPVLW